jgi:hypothetical protein
MRTRTLLLLVVLLACTVASFADDRKMLQLFGRRSVRPARPIILGGAAGLGAGGLLAGTGAATQVPRPGAQESLGGSLLFAAPLQSNASSTGSCAR